MTKHILECENCGGNVNFDLNSKAAGATGAVGAIAGGVVATALFAPLGFLGAIVGGVGGVKAGTSGGGPCEQCGAMYAKKAINTLREKTQFTLPTSKVVAREPVGTEPKTPAEFRKALWAAARDGKSREEIRELYRKAALARKGFKA